MNYELNEHFAQLHQHIINEQLQIKTLIKMLQGCGEVGLQPEIVAPINNKIHNLKDVRENMEMRQRRSKKPPQNEEVSNHTNWLIIGEKESNFNIFLKLNGQLQKWIELELSVIKEMIKLQNNDATNLISTELQTNDLEILHNFYKQNELKTEPD